MKKVLKFQEGEGSLSSASCEVFVCLFVQSFFIFEVVVCFSCAS
jgi:hypothetical protein